MTAILDQVLDAYIKAWSEGDRATRDALLAIAWAEDGVYADPQVEAQGRAALSDYIGVLHAKMPGARLDYTSGIAEHHGRIHFSWCLVAADGKVPLQGVDFGRLDADGRLKEITGFFGELPQA